MRWLGEHTVDGNTTTLKMLAPRSAVEVLTITVEEMNKRGSGIRVTVVYRLGRSPVVTISGETDQVRRWKKIARQTLKDFNLLPSLG